MLCCIDNVSLHTGTGGPFKPDTITVVGKGIVFPSMSLNPGYIILGMG